MNLKGSPLYGLFHLSLEINITFPVLRASGRITLLEDNLKSCRLQNTEEACVSQTKPKSLGLKVMQANNSPGENTSFSVEDAPKTKILIPQDMMDLVLL